MSFAILRIEKLKGSLGGLGKHIDRSYEGKTSVPDNAVESLVNNNIHWDRNGKSYTQVEWNEYSLKNSLSTRINDEIKKRYSLNKKIRKDAVKGIEYIMTSDNYKMNEIFSDREIYEAWIKDNRDFLSSIYGKENIVSMHLHLDEKTPHLHVVVVPITKEGRLSCKSFINGKKDLSIQQTEYADLMRKFGMKRGVYGSKTKHQRPNELKYESTNRYVNR